MASSRERRSSPRAAFSCARKRRALARAGEIVTSVSTLRAIALFLIVASAGATAAVTIGAQPTPSGPEIHHIHGLAIDRQDPEVVYIATHTGLVRLRPNAAAEWIGEQRFDLMGFTAHPQNADVVYASGHPDLQTYAREKVGNLGLLVSRDRGKTWQSVAL